ncbi:hypothetical protein CR203_24805 [Salipaludibacillus neizhouensis]|uniref:Uncharacterized protein n=1 Tax=Salipaludibacillus neizhouensis TaxID=885475 RepID=A0A3A9K0I6_9BACI|nr:hypothetical protein CR203_24805 [Salipaludibacillus neizhouensis]
MAMIYLLLFFQPTRLFDATLFSILGFLASNFPLSFLFIANEIKKEINDDILLNKRSSVSSTS